MKLTQIIVAIMKHDEVIISERKNYARKKCARNQSYKRKYCFTNKISVEDNVIAAECTLLFDVDKYFGTTTKKDNTWISFDVCWTPNGSVHAEYRLRSFDECCKCLVDWRLTEEEQEIILDKMEEYCMQETGKTLQELWDSYEAE